MLFRSNLITSGGILQANINSVYSNIQWKNVTSTNDIFFLSNVFIGTSTPLTTHKLVVSGNTAIYGNVYVYGTSSNIFGNLTIQNNCVVQGNVLVYGATSNIYGNLTVQSNCIVQGNVICSDTFLNDIYVYGNVVTPYDLYVSNIYSVNFLKTLGGSISDEFARLSTLNSMTIRAPYSFQIRSGNLPIFWLNALPSLGSSVEFDILVDGNTIYGTKPTIGSSATSNSSVSSSGSLALNPTNVNYLQAITVKVTNAGLGNPCGAKYIIYCF